MSPTSTEVGRLADLYEQQGPFVTAYIDARSNVEQAGDRLETRWKALRQRLEADGVARPALDALESGIGRRHAGGDTLALVAAEDGRLLLRRHLPEPPARDVAVCGPLPYLAPLVEWEQSMPGHVVVLADKEGAEIVAFPRGAVAGDEEDATAAEIVEGDTEHIHRGKPGGWSQRRFQQRAEETWDHNAQAVAEQVARVTRATAADLVVATGDERALELLATHLPGDVAHRLRTVAGGREPDVSEEIADEVVRLVATAVAEETVTLLDRFAAERSHGRAADGPSDTLAALSRSQVEVLLVHDDPADARTAWSGEAPVPVALDPAPLEELGARPVEARLVDTAVRAALGTGARVWMVPAHGPDMPTGGLGALLRFDSL